MNKSLVALLSLGLLFSGSFVYAVEAETCEEYCNNMKLEAPVNDLTMPEGAVCYCNPLTGTGLESITEPIIGFIFKISIVIVPVLVIYSAFMIITAAGDVSKVEQAKKIIFWTLIGFMIVLLSRGMSDLIEVIIGI